MRGTKGGRTYDASYFLASINIKDDGLIMLRAKACSFALILIVSIFVHGAMYEVAARSLGFEIYSGPVQIWIVIKMV